MSLPDKALASILQLPADKRLHYTLKAIAEADCLYVLADEDENWSFWSEDNGQTVLPIWPEQELACRARDAEDASLCVFELQLEDFLTEGVPWLMENGYALAIFPLLNTGPNPVMQARDFAGAVNQLLGEWFDEALDLPYLKD